MSEMPRAVAAGLVLACSVAFAAVPAAAQTASPAPSDPAAQSGPAPDSGKKQITATGDQAQAVLKSLEGLLVQSLSGFQPSVGASVPPDLQTQPMPPAAKSALPEAKDHHVVKTDDQTILIVDPATRQVVGVIQAMSDSSAPDDGGTTGQGGSDSGSSR